jgi:hypothetical protein
MRRHKNGLGLTVSPSDGAAFQSFMIIKTDGITAAGAPGFLVGS